MTRTDLFFENNFYRCENAELTDGIYLSVKYSGVSGCSHVDIAVDSPEKFIYSMSVIGYHGFPEKNIAHIRLEG